MAPAAVLPAARGAATTLAAATKALAAPPSCRRRPASAPLLRHRRGREACSTVLCSSSSTSGQAPPSEAPQPLGAGAASASGQGSPYGWTFDLSKPQKPDPKVQDIPIELIRRPLGKTRSNDQAKVAALMESIKAIGLQEPIDVLLVDNVWYGFSGCHRFEAHQRLGLPTIRCRVRKANQQVLKMHLM